MWGGPKTNNNTKPNQERNNSFQYVAKTPQTTGRKLTFLVDLTFLASPQPSTPPAQKPQKVAATKTAPTQNPEPMPTEGETAVETVTAQQDLSEKVLFTGLSPSSSKLTSSSWLWGLPNCRVHSAPQKQLY